MIERLHVALSWVGQLPLTVVIYVALLLAGVVVLLGVSIRWWRQGGGDPLRGSPLRANRLTLLHVWLCWAAYVVGVWVGAAIERHLAPGSPEVRGVLGASTANLLAIAACLLVAHVAFLGGLRGFGFGRCRAGFIIGSAVGGWLAALAICEGVNYLTRLAVRIAFPHFQPPEHTVFKALADASVPAWLRVLAVVGAFAIAPAGEELLFRGILQTAVKKIMPRRRGSMIHRWLAILVTAAVFGLMHVGTPQFVPALVALAIVLGFLYERSGSLLVPILVHMLFNGRSLLWYELQSQGF